MQWEFENRKTQYIMTDNKTFDELWERAETERYAAQLTSEYPTWRAGRRRTTGIVATVAVILAVATPIMLPHHKAGKFEKVYCNRANTQDQQWVALADELLTSDII